MFVISAYILNDISDFLQKSNHLYDLFKTSFLNVILLYMYIYIYISSTIFIWRIYTEEWCYKIEVMSLCKIMWDADSTADNHLAVIIFTNHGASL